DEKHRHRQPSRFVTTQEELLLNNNRLERRDMAKAVRFYEAGGPEVLRYEDVEVGDPGPGEVRLRHVAVGLNYADTYFRNGTYPIPMPNGVVAVYITSNRAIASCFMPTQVVSA